MRTNAICSLALAALLLSLGCSSDTKDEPGSACTPGTSQACAGPSACSGFQVCRSDGSGFDACDCSGGTGGSAGGDAGGDSGQSFCPSGLPGPEMVEIPALDGSRYCIDSTEVTLSQFDPFLATSPAKETAEGLCKGLTPSLDATCMNQLANVGPNQPVSCANWCTARAYCAWAGKRLCGRIGGGSLTPEQVADAAQSQWLNACSAGGKQKYAYGDVPVDSCKPTTFFPVKTHSECEGGFPGVFDLSGNVAEWVDGCFSNTQGGTCPRSNYFSECDSFVQTNYFASNAGFRCCHDGESGRGGGQ